MLFIIEIYLLTICKMLTTENKKNRRGNCWISLSKLDYLMLVTSIYCK